MIVVTRAKRYVHHFQSITEKLESMRKKKSEAHKEIQLKRKEADSNIERQKKAQWAICLSNRRVTQYIYIYTYITFPCISDYVFFFNKLFNL